MSEVNAYITEENGQLVLHDPAAAGMITAVAEHNYQIGQENCQLMYDKNLEGIQRFRQRFDEKGYRTEDYCIVVIQVDGPYGGPITDIIMPGHDWQSIRDQGMEPIARGITDRQLIRDAIVQFAPAAAEALDRLDYAVVVIASSTARVYAV